MSDVPSAGKLRRLIQIALVLFWIALLTATHLPPRHMPSVKVNDKVEHLAAYTMLATLIGLSWDGRQSVRLVLLATLLIVMCSGAIDEWTQPIFGRDCEFNDWLADCAGAAIGSTIAVVSRAVVKI